MPTIATEARVETDTPGRYITRLCKHFAHKVPAEHADGQGRITFPFGTCALRAEEGVLVLHGEAEDEEGLQQVEDVVGRHLERFAAPDALDVTWTRSW